MQCAPTSWLEEHAKCKESPKRSPHIGLQCAIGREDMLSREALADGKRDTN